MPALKLNAAFQQLAGDADVADGHCMEKAHSDKGGGKLTWPLLKALSFLLLILAFAMVVGVLVANVSDCHSDASSPPSASAPPPPLNVAPPMPPLLPILPFKWSIGFVGQHGNKRLASHQCINALQTVYLSAAIPSFLSASFITSAGLYTLARQWFADSGSTTRRTLLEILTMNAACNAIFALRYIVTAVAFKAGHEEVLNNLEIVTHDVSTFCQVMAWWGQFFIMASVSWSFVAVVYLFLTVAATHRCGGLSADHRRRFLNVAHLYVWLLSLTTCLCAYFNEGMSCTTDGTCWLTGSSVLAFVVPFYVYMVVALLVLGYTAYKRHLLTPIYVDLGRKNNIRGGIKGSKSNVRGAEGDQDGGGRRGTALDNLVLRLFIFTVFFIGTWCFLTAEELVALAGGLDSLEPWIAFASAFLTAASGLSDTGVWIAVFASNLLVQLERDESDRGLFFSAVVRKVMRMDTPLPEDASPDAERSSTASASARASLSCSTSMVQGTANGQSSAAWSPSTGTARSQTTCTARSDTLSAISVSLGISRSRPSDSPPT